MWWLEEGVLGVGVAGVAEEDETACSVRDEEGEAEERCCLFFCFSCDCDSVEEDAEDGVDESCE